MFGVWREHVCLCMSTWEHVRACEYVHAQGRARAVVSRGIIGWSGAATCQPALDRRPHHTRTRCSLNEPSRCHATLSSSTTPRFQAESTALKLDNLFLKFNNSYSSSSWKLTLSKWPRSILNLPSIIEERKDHTSTIQTPIYRVGGVWDEREEVKRVGGAWLNRWRRKHQLPASSTGGWSRQQAPKCPVDSWQF